MSTDTDKQLKRSLSEQDGQFTREATLQDIPDIIRDIILDLLTIPEILKLREVSKDCGRWVNCYRKLEKRLSNTTVTFKSLGDVGSFNSSVTFLPFTSFKLSKNVPLQESRELTLFTKQHSENVISLSLHAFDSCVTDFEYNFLESLTKIKKLHIKTIHRLEPGRISRIPQNCLKNLESLGYDILSTNNYPYSMLKFCLNLKHLSLGYHQYNDESGEYVQDLIDFLVEKNLLIQDSNRLDKIVIDFGPYYTHCVEFQRKSHAQQFFKRIAQMKGKVELLNFQTSQLYKLKPDPPSLTTEDVNNFLFSIKSVQGVNDRLISFTFPSLESIKLERKDYFLCYFSNPNDYLELTEDPWPKLKSVEGVVNTGRVEADPHPDLIADPPSNFRFYQTLFRPNRTSITTLNLEIDLSDSFKRSVESIYLLKNFASNFPNLKKLRLKCTEFKTFNFIHLLTLLAEHNKIEDLTLVFSHVISDKTFFGNSRKEPLLLKLTRLKHLRLEIESGNVKNFTTSAFVNIFALMPLLSFEIIDQSLQFSAMNITYEGFNALLENRFGKTIQNFKFESEDFNSPERQKIACCLDRIQQRCVLNNRYSLPRTYNSS